MPTIEIIDKMVFYRDLIIFLILVIIIIIILLIFKMFRKK